MADLMNAPPPPVEARIESRVFRLERTMCGCRDALTIAYKYWATGEVNGISLLWNCEPTLVECQNCGAQWNAEDQ